MIFGVECFALLHYAPYHIDFYSLDDAMRGFITRRAGNSTARRLPQFSPDIVDMMGIDQYFAFARAIMHTLPGGDY